MSYDTLATNLPALASVQTKPLNTEARNVLGDVDRQTRAFVHDFLATVFTDASPALLKSTALPALTTAMLAALVEDSSVHTTLSESKVNLAYTTTTLYNAIVALQTLVAYVKSNGPVSGSNRIITELDSTYLLAGTVPNNSVTDAKIVAATGIQLSKLQVGGAQNILVADSSGIWTAVALSGDATIVSNGALTLASRGVAIVTEQMGIGVSPGASNSAGQYRGNFVKVNDPQSIVSQITDSGTHIKLTAGTYLVEVTVPGYAVAYHYAVLEQYYSAGGSTSFYGLGSIAPTATQTNATIKAYVVALANDYLMVKHYPSTNAVSSGMGYPMSPSGATVETYTTVVIQKLFS